MDGATGRPANCAVCQSDAAQGAEEQYRLWTRTMIWSCSARIVAAGGAVGE